MAMALELAERGAGWTSPNPMVGAVLVKDGAVIGRGWHRRCGGLHAEREALADCTCSPAGVSRYLSRVSGPLLDRIDLHIEVPPVEFDQLSASGSEEPSAAIQQRVERARALQRERYRKHQASPAACNAKILPELLKAACPMTESARRLLKLSFEKLGLSARAYDRILKVARTIADLDQEEIIQSGHMAEAVQYRSLDRKYWTERR